MDTTCIPALHLFVHELSKQEVKITVFTLHYPFKQQEYIWNGITVVPLNGQNKFLRRKLMFSKLIKKFSQENQKVKIDIIHTFWLNEATVFGMKLGEKFNIPVISTAMGQDVLPQNKWLKKLDFSKLSVLSVLSQFHYLEAEKSTIRNAEIIPFGIVEKSGEQINKTIDFIGVGNLIPLKQFNYFLDVMAEIKKTHPVFSAKIIGDGIERSILKEQLINQKLEDNVELCGLLNYDETLKEIASAKVLIHPSKYESFGMIFTEAMSLQTHVLASPVGLAMEEEQIQKLQFDLKNDAEFALKLLGKSLPNQKIYKVNDTVNAFLEIYNRF